MNKAWRVSISNFAVGCYNCDENDLTESEKNDFISTGDYCDSCQHVTVEYVDQRSDYADETVGYFDTQEEAKEVANKLKPFSF
jgi:hypothetical protein